MPVKKWFTCESSVIEGVLVSQYGDGSYNITFLETVIEENSAAEYLEQLTAAVNWIKAERAKEAEIEKLKNWNQGRGIIDPAPSLQVV